MSNNYEDYIDVPYHIWEEATVNCGEAQLACKNLVFEDYGQYYSKYDPEDFEIMRNLVANYSKDSEYPSNIVLGVSYTLIAELEEEVKEKFADQ